MLQFLKRRQQIRHRATPAAIKAARKDYMDGISRNSGYVLDSGTFVDEFGYVVSDPRHRKQGLADRISAALLTQGKESIYATTRDDNTGIHKILQRNSFTNVGEKWRSRQHPGSSVMLWIRLA